MKLIYHNVQWADFTRLEEISTHTKCTDFVICIGTGRWAESADMTATQCQLPNHKCVQMGWRKSRTSNNSCGLAVMYGKRVQGSLQQVAVPPTKLGITGR
eukprot:5806938-Pyramimonas_sp.AAC.1